MTSALPAAVIAFLAAACWPLPTAADPLASCLDGIPEGQPIAVRPPQGLGLPRGDGLVGARPPAAVAVACPPAAAGPDPVPLPGCIDGRDDDGDGTADFPADPDCASPQDGELPDCRDGLDNDGDGSSDADDPDCADDADPSESSCGPEDPLACGGPAPCPAFPLPPSFVETKRTAEGTLVTWEAALLEPTAYLVYRLTLPTTPLPETSSADPLIAPIAGVGGGVTSYLDDTASPNLAYLYWVTSAGSGCQSAPSNMSASATWIPDTSDCVFLGLSDDPPGAEPEVRGTECLPI